VAELLLSRGTVSRRARWVDSGVAALGVLLAATIAAFARWGPDWPAQEFRAWSAQHDGLTAWTNWWYSGQALPGYSVIYPAVSSHLGAAVTGVAAVLVATIGASRLAPSSGSRLRLGYHVSVALVLAADLLIGQVPYLVGVAFAVWGLWAVRVHRPLAATVLAAGASLSSPLAGAFVLLAIPALVSAYGWRRATPFTAAVAGVAVSVVVGGASGAFPFSSRVFLWTAAFAAAAIAVGFRRNPVLRTFGVTYAIAAVGAFLVPNPIGGNLARLGQLVALPLVWHVLPQFAGVRWRRSVSVVLIAFGGLWPIWPSITSMARGAADPSQSRVYYAGVLGFLRTQDPAKGRLEIVFTREHWESLWVAQHFPLARGWERQTDMSQNAVLYHPITATSYRHWLDDNAVSLVALPRVPIDFGGKAESALLAHPPSYLIPVWHDANWRVWRVRNAQGIVSGPATLVTLGAASVVLDFRGSGTATVHVRSSQMWGVTDGEACISNNRNGWVTVTSPHPGRVTLRARVSTALSPDEDCA
jgi:hypothetical protein